MTRSLSEICSRSCCTTGSWLASATGFLCASRAGTSGQCRAIRPDVRWYAPHPNAGRLRAFGLLAGQEVLRLDVLEELAELLDDGLLGGLGLALELDGRLVDH